MIVVKNIGRGVSRVHRSANALIARAEIAVSHILRHSYTVCINHLAIPWAILAMRCNDYPFFAQRMPALLPQALRGPWYMCVHALLLLNAKTLDLFGFHL